MAVAVTGLPVGALPPAAAVGPLARVLVEGGPTALPAALALLADSLGASAATLREVRPDGRPGRQHRSGGVVPSARTGGSTLDIPLRAGGRVVGLLTIHGLPAEVRVSQLGAAADVFALAVLGAQRDPARVATELLLGAEADADLVAGMLHDGPAQALLAARYQLELGSSASEDVRAGVEEALRDTRATMSRLRTRRLRIERKSGPVEVPGDARGVAPAVDGAGEAAELARSLIEQTGLAVSVSGAVPATLPEALSIVAYRLTQAAAFDAVARHARAFDARFEATADQLTADQLLVVTMSDDGTPGVPHQPWLARWLARVGYLGGRVVSPPEGGLRAVLPVASPPIDDGGHP